MEYRSKPFSHPCQVDLAKQQVNGMISAMNMVICLLLCLLFRYLLLPPKHTSSILASVAGAGTGAACDSATTCKETAWFTPTVAPPWHLPDAQSVPCAVRHFLVHVCMPLSVNLQRELKALGCHLHVTASLIPICCQGRYDCMRHGLFASTSTCFL